MHWPPLTVARALELSAAGKTDRQVGEQLGVPLQTVRGWKRGTLPRAYRLLAEGRLCHDCGGSHDLPDLPSELYAYLLGLYLGDGCLARTTGSWSLRIGMDRAYPGIVAECRSALAAIGPSGRGTVTPSNRDASVVVCAYGREWPASFPQHGPGKKHEREIALEPWQRRHVERAPGRLLRGLIHSDGWRGENRVNVKGRDYSYPRYQFSSRSGDIRRIFTDTCDLTGIAWRPWGRWHISVARREAVGLLDEHVGPKA